jgi:hypothetical protein
VYCGRRLRECSIAVLDFAHSQPIRHALNHDASKVQTESGCSVFCLLSSSMGAILRPRISVLAHTAVVSRNRAPRKQVTHANRLGKQHSPTRTVGIAPLSPFPLHQLPPSSPLSTNTLSLPLSHPFFLNTFRFPTAARRPPFSGNSKEGCGTMVYFNAHLFLPFVSRFFLWPPRFRQQQLKVSGLPFETVRCLPLFSSNNMVCFAFLSPSSLARVPA